MLTTSAPDSLRATTGRPLQAVLDEQINGPDIPAHAPTALNDRSPARQITRAHKAIIATQAAQIRMRARAASGERRPVNTSTGNATPA